MISQLVQSPVAPVVVGLTLAWFDLISSEPFDRLTYAVSYAQGHIDLRLWTQAQAAEFLQRAWLNNLPGLLHPVLLGAGITGALLCIQRYWRLTHGTLGGR